MFNLLNCFYRSERVKMAAETGKRYKCSECEAEFIVTRGSDDVTLQCGDHPLEQM